MAGRKPRRPFTLGLKLTWYITKNLLRGKKRFPMVTMLEPLETCNLTCKGCGRIREYKDSVIRKNKLLSVEECLRVVEESGAPIVSIAGGEPMIHPGIVDIVEGIIAQKRFVYLCTNALLLERALTRFKPSKYLCFVIHLDGMEKVHDYWVEREGVWTIAMAAAKKALEQGYRVCSNTTLFRDSDFEDLNELFGTLTDLGFEGIMVSAGYPYQSVTDRDIFMERRESIKAFRKILDPKHGFRFYNSPLYLSFLRGERDHPCTAWSNPTYTPLGWRKPCYLMADEHVDSVAELMDEELWKQYGPGKDPRCGSCMMHSGFEAGSIVNAFRRPRGLLTLVREGRRWTANGKRNGSQSQAETSDAEAREPVGVEVDGDGEE